LTLPLEREPVFKIPVSNEGVGLQDADRRRASRQRASDLHPQPGLYGDGHRGGVCLSTGGEAPGPGT
jgi:hypothetical protein